MKKLLSVMFCLALLAGCSSSDGSGLSLFGGNVVPGEASDFVASAKDRVFFGFNSSRLDSEATENLDEQVEWLKEYNTKDIVLEGHCDERGTREYNLALGERRANAVKQYLVSQGVSASRIKVISYGKEKPAVMGSNESAWAQNRRAVTIVK